MIIIENQPAEWTGKTIVCIFCKTKIKLQADDQPTYASPQCVRLGRGESWVLEWTCPSCGQTIKDVQFFKYPERVAER